MDSRHQHDGEEGKRGGKEKGEKEEKWGGGGNLEVIACLLWKYSITLC